MDDQPATAEEIPALYRAILDGVARLERGGERVEAARIRSEAIRAYSAAWDPAHRKRLEALLRRVDRAVEGLQRAAAARPLRERAPSA